ncbi:hypothetical protein [Lacticigenium naphthae]|uniref:hypothetical protein n=1 Tax=Lacticigenium naphthae TaxID=515351 RepID=UPI000402B9F9|nr:hypothetical protein [Lacticigenium naphthae]
MESVVHGYYDDFKDAIRAYDTFVMKGYPTDRFHLIVNEKMKNAFQLQTDIPLITDYPSEAELLEEYASQLQSDHFLLLVTHNKT